MPIMQSVVMIPVTLLDHTSTVALLLTCMPASTASIAYYQTALCALVHIIAHAEHAVGHQPAVPQHSHTCPALACSSCSRRHLLAFMHLLPIVQLDLLARSPKGMFKVFCACVTHL